MTRAAIRFVVEHVLEEDCPDCKGENKHKRIVGIEYELPDGSRIKKLEVGDAFFTPCTKCRDWDNCPGQHLNVVVPNDPKNDWAYTFDIDARAGNCGKKADRTHRCWIRHGDVTKGELHVDKGVPSQTCVAGAGSLQTQFWHGFIDHNFVVEKRGQKP